MTAARQQNKGPWTGIIVAAICLVIACLGYGCVYETQRTECEQGGGHLEPKFLNNPKYGYKCIDGKERP